MGFSKVGRTLAAVMVAGAAAFAVGCGESDEESAAGASSESRDLTIGSVVYGIDSYQTQHAKVMEEYGKEKGVTIRTVNSKNDVSVQANGIQDLVAAQVDGIVMQPVDPAAATPMVKAAQEAGIPVLTWAVGPVPDVEVPFVALDESAQTREAGVHAAEWVTENKPGEEVAMVVIDILPNPNCRTRMDGFIEGVKSVDAQAKLVARPDGNGQRLKSQNAMEDVIQSGRDFNIVTACNGEMLLGALSALEAAGRGKADDKQPLTEYMFSIDGSPGEIEKLLDPSSALMETLSLTPRDNVRVLLDTLLELVDGEIGNDYQGKVESVLLPNDCTKINEILTAQYDKTVPCD